MSIIKREKDGLWVPEEIEANYKLIQGGIYNKELFDASLKYINDFGTALDLGAHVGTWTKALAEKFKLAVGFEFAPEAIECFWLNCTGTKAALVEYPVMHAEVQIGLEDDWDSSLSYCMKPEGEIHSTYIDAYKFDHPVNFIKLNIEGAEPYALMGGVMTIMRDKPVITLEWKYEHRFGFNKGFCERFLTELDYTRAERLDNSDIYIWGKNDI